MELITQPHKNRGQDTTGTLFDKAGRGGGCPTVRLPNLGLGFVVSF